MVTETAALLCTSFESQAHFITATTHLNYTTERKQGSFCPLLQPVLALVCSSRPVISEFDNSGEMRVAKQTTFPVDKQRHSEKSLGERCPFPRHSPRDLPAIARSYLLMKLAFLGTTEQPSSNSLGAASPAVLCVLVLTGIPTETRSTKTSLRTEDLRLQDVKRKQMTHEHCLENILRRTILVWHSGPFQMLNS